MNRSDYLIRRLEPGDEYAWDAYAAAHSDGSPYHLCAWKEAVEQAYGHPGHYLLAERGDRLAGILPLIHLRLAPLVNELTGLPFCDVGTLLGDDAQAAELLLERALELAGELGGAKLQLRGEIALPAAMTERIRPVETGKVRMFLALPGSAEELFAAFKSKLRSQIRKAEKNGLEFHWAGADEIGAYYAVFSRNMRDLGSPVHSRKWFEALLAGYGNDARLGLVSWQGRAVGCCLLLACADRIAIPWASTLRSYNRLAPNMLLYWNALKFAADSGFASFDFGRSSEGEGTFRFKKQWGARPRPLRWYAAPAEAAAAASGGAAGSLLSRDTLENLWRRLPLSVANGLGPRLRKYISL